MDKTLHDYNDYPIEDKYGRAYMWTRNFDFPELNYKVRYPIWVPIFMFSMALFPGITMITLAILLLRPITYAAIPGLSFFLIAYYLWPKLDKYVFMYVDKKQLWRRFEDDTIPERPDDDKTDSSNQ